MRKKSTISQISIVWCFSIRTDQFYKFYKKKILSKPFFLKKVDFCIFNPKNVEVKENCSETPLIVCPLKCTYIGKNSLCLVANNEFEK